MNFDLHAMRVAIKGRRLRIPGGLTREQFRKWMKLHAKRLEEKE